MYNNFGDIDGLTDGSGNGFSRFGLQVGLGTEISIIPVVNLDVFAGYNWYNLTGKEDGEDTVTAFVIDVLVIFNFL